MSLLVFVEFKIANLHYVAAARERRGFSA